MGDHEFTKVHYFRNAFSENNKLEQTALQTM